MSKLTFKQKVWIAIIALILLAVLYLALSIGFKVIGFVLSWFGSGFVCGIIFILILLLVINNYKRKNKNSKA